MGIRIHKSIGYGLIEIGGRADPRFNSDCFDNIYDADEGVFLDFLKNKDKCAKSLVREFGFSEKDAGWEYMDIEISIKELDCRGDIKIYPFELFDDDTEVRNDWILFYDISHTKGHHSWKRYNDTIDHYENYIYSSREPRIVNLMEHGINGIFPYDSAMHLKPGRVNRLKEIIPEYFSDVSKKPDTIDSGHFNVLLGKWDKENSHCFVTDEIKQHMLEDWHPRIPTSILLFVHFFNVFKNPHTVYDLKPMLCEWWG